MKDTMIPFGLYDTETHKVLYTPSIHFNVSYVCHTQDIKVVHKFLPYSAQHVCMLTRGSSAPAPWLLLWLAASALKAVEEKEWHLYMCKNCIAQPVGWVAQIAQMAEHWYGGLPR